MIRFLFIFFLIMPFFAFAQLVELQEKGVLIVRLESGVNQTAALEAKIEAGENVAVFQRELEKRQANLATKNRLLLDLFEEEYTFSDILFMYDTSSVALKQASDASKASDALLSGYFLDANLKIDPKLTLNNRPFLIVSETLGASGVEGFVILDGDLNRVQKPTPDFIKFNTLFYLFNSLGSTELAEKKMYRSAIRQLQKKFEKEVGRR